MIGAIIHSLEDAIADRLPAHTRFGLVEQWNTDQGYDLSNTKAVGRARWCCKMRA